MVLVTLATPFEVPGGRVGLEHRLTFLVAALDLGGHVQMATA